MSLNYGNVDLHAFANQSFAFCAAADVAGGADGNWSSSYFDFKLELARATFRAALSDAIAEASEARSQVPTASVQLTENFVQLLPRNLGFPEPSITSAGDIVLDWVREKSIFSVLIEPLAKISYASLNDRRHERMHGELPYEGDRIPPRLLRLIAEWTDATS